MSHYQAYITDLFMRKWILALLLFVLETALTRPEKTSILGYVIS